jgi:hypothetical protein
MFYIAEPIKKLSLKHSFCENGFYMFFLLSFIKRCLFLCFKSAFKKLWKFLFFALLQINNFFIYFQINLMRWYQKKNFKIKKIILIHFQVKNTLKNNRNHTSKHNYIKHFIHIFLLYINFNHNFTKYIFKIN